MSTIPAGSLRSGQAFITPLTGKVGYRIRERSGKSHVRRARLGVAVRMVRGRRLVLSPHSLVKVAA